MPVPPLPLTKRFVSHQGDTTVKPPLRVFICDDDLDFAEEMAAGLTAHGFETEKRAGHAAPIDAIRAFQPDVILLDIFMPQPNGFEIIDGLRGDPALKPIPLVLMSGTDTGLLDVARQFCAGHSMRVMATLQKPLKLAEVVRICR